VLLLVLLVKLEGVVVVDGHSSYRLEQSIHPVMVVVAVVGVACGCRRRGTIFIGHHSSDVGGGSPKP
jgi:hypothetical protein